ncbi:ATP-binding cassette domain-containing protein [candidate division KSB1 bacterium]|nr:ATP-binding cassette domain-containing protein [candidate division KSB1 bacterium]NIR69650.1 ATP-binding cassette domain-containing protein [candidate division KSB1 bacterium]NIS22879.1 ATP-binding cassette domain-containing protein [candidate division KSB1 bacterium]NIT69717.1 ATP-binding cassette domain-containing protein [candidate division KSB1 bacterium]NIU23385.1 ATP-binding cassette domain-containing protein [candidate division KSB1 bacterium]
METVRPTVEVINVSKAYGTLKAVDELSFKAYRGEIFGLLGPNGAGKTTTLEMIEGLRKPDTGNITIDGYDVQKQLKEVTEVIGVQLQSTSIYNKIKVGEALKLFAGYYKNRRSSEELLKLVALEDKVNTYHQDLSGGQQQRLALALALVNDPTVVFLDEPTTGLDPQARRNLWDIISKMKSDEKTVILTTHYMEEAERLCDRIAIMDHGRKIAEGTPRELIAQLNVESCLEFSANGLFDSNELGQLPSVSKVLAKGEEVELFSKNPHNTLVSLIDLSKSRQAEIKNLHVRRPTLEDLFLELTGRSLRE